MPFKVALVTSLLDGEEIIYPIPENSDNIAMPLT